MRSLFSDAPHLPLTLIDSTASLEEGGAAGPGETVPAEAIGGTCKEGGAGAPKEPSTAPCDGEPPLSYADAGVGVPVGGVGDGRPSASGPPWEGRHGGISTVALASLPTKHGTEQGEALENGSGGGGHLEKAALVEVLHVLDSSEGSEPDVVMEQLAVDPSTCVILGLPPQGNEAGGEWGNP